MATREFANLTSAPPLYTPADRLDALHLVAQAARRVREAHDRGTSRDVAAALRLSDLLIELMVLDRIERYLGLPQQGAA